MGVDVTEAEEREAVYEALRDANGKRATFLRLIAETSGVMTLRNALARAANEEHRRELTSAHEAAMRGEPLALHVVCAWNRVEELRGILNEMAAAIGRESYVEAIERARRLNDGASINDDWRGPPSEAEVDEHHSRYADAKGCSRWHMRHGDTVFVVIIPARTPAFYPNESTRWRPADPLHTPVAWSTPRGER